jgi:redox-sensitive bicupin YhaK (pirin superfamily)
VGGDSLAGGGGTAATAPRLLLFADGDEVRVESDEQPARFLLVSGKPLGEPIARYGPFVMTTRAEIEQALRDLRADEFVWRDDAEWLRARRAPAG